jgi:hypothetical protein
MRKFASKSVLFIALNVLDCALTYIIIHNNGIEVMPISRWLLLNFGFSAFATAKVVFASLVVVAVYMFRRPRMLNMLNVLMSIVCLIGLISITCLALQ